MALVRNSDQVLKVFLLLAGRNRHLLGIRLADLRSYLVDTIECIGGSD